VVVVLAAVVVVVVVVVVLVLVVLVSVIALLTFVVLPLLLLLFVRLLPAVPAVLLFPSVVPLLGCAAASLSNKHCNATEYRISSRDKTLSNLLASLEMSMN
jgi:hypothetical protein